MLSEVDNNEIHQAYQHAIKDKESLESDNYILRNEVDRLLRLVPKGNVTHSRSISNASSINIEEDFGYSSARNTLDVKKAGFSTPPMDAHLRADNSKIEGFSTPEILTAKISKINWFYDNAESVFYFRINFRLFYANKELGYGFDIEIEKVVRR